VEHLDLSICDVEARLLFLMSGASLLISGTILALLSI
jgi:hypothetical protein